MNLTHSAMDVVNSIIENNGSAVSFERAGIYLREHKNTNIIGNIIRTTMVKRYMHRGQRRAANQK